MSGKKKDKASILNKLGIDALNPMQEEAIKCISDHSEIMLLSPTGTGKTLAFLLPILEELDPKLNEVQVLILVPSRELAIQIEQVTKDMGSGFKTNAVYGGRAISKDKIELKSPPAILIGTPGRVADHMRRETISTEHIKILVLDEFDKSLEIGFAEDMMEIIDALPALNKKVLTSATRGLEIPDFVKLKNLKILSFLEESSIQLHLKLVISPAKDKLQTLSQLIRHIGGGNGIVFCNFTDSIQTVSDYLDNHQIDHVCFYGGLEQLDRERALIKFRNGTHRLLIATDLAARGIDVPEMDFIIHYELPPREEEFIHRNGRTARMNSEGTSYILRWEKENIPSFIIGVETLALTDNNETISQKWETLFISGGRKDKISKGDIAGLFFKQGNLSQEELGLIELKQDCAFVSVPRAKANKLVELLNNSKLKKKKVRINRLK